MQVRGLSTVSRAANKYIDTWLGNDLGGERWTTRLMNGTSSMHENAPLTTNNKRVDGAVVSKTMKRFVAQVVTIDWSASLDKIHENIKTLYSSNNNRTSGSSSTKTQTQSCLLDFASAPANLEASRVDEVVAAVRAVGLIPVAAVGAEHCSSSIEHSSLPLPLWSSLSDALVAPARPVERVEVQQAKAKAAAAKEKALQEASASAFAAKVKAPPEATPSLVHTGTVRSGQQLYAEGTSLIVIGSVNDGAELLADGDIHVYGKLQGRAIAGLSGDTTARVFARGFSPSLLGIADGFVMMEDAEGMAHVLGKSVCVAYRNPGDVAPSGRSGGVLDCGDGKELVVTILEQ